MTLCALILLSGCGLDPFGTDTVAPIEGTGVRITEGVGTRPNYADSAGVAAGNVAQFEATVGEGENVVVTLPRGPADRLVAEFRLEGSKEALGTATLLSRDGKPISVGEAVEFDPGYIGIEHQSTADRVQLRLAFPRLIDTEQGQVQFTFKVPVR
ncbi:MAG TPA: hypothetical protein VHV53_11025 [Solirubrobacterales bacterium]|nr:hypothetical protein [Solirubrobacterales bacterium]